MTSIRLTLALMGILSLLTHSLCVADSTSLNTATATVKPSPFPTAETMSPTKSLAPTTSPSPTPSPQPAAGTEFIFAAKNGTNNTVVVCARVSAQIELTIKYQNETKKTVERKLNVTDMFPGVDANRSTCGEKNVVMTIGFFKEKSHVHYLSFNFKNTSSKEYELTSISTILDMTDNKQFPAFNHTKIKNVTGMTDEIFSTSYNKYYDCSSSRSYDIGVSNYSTVSKLTLKVYDFKAQAFSFKNNTVGNFTDSSKCSSDQRSSKIVPIAVGAALAGLVIVVLIAYLIGRFRSRKQNSYEALS